MLTYETNRDRMIRLQVEKYQRSQRRPAPIRHMPRHEPPPPQELHWTIHNSFLARFELHDWSAMVIVILSALRHFSADVLHRDPLTMIDPLFRSLFATATLISVTYLAGLACALSKNSFRITQEKRPA
jgi:hypothetical protein